MSLSINHAKQPPIDPKPVMSESPKFRVNGQIIEKTQNTPYLSSLGSHLTHRIDYTDPLTNEHRVTSPIALIKALVGDWDDPKRGRDERDASHRKAEKLIKFFDRNGDQTIDGAINPFTLKAFHGVGEVAKRGSEFENLLKLLIILNSAPSA